MGERRVGLLGGTFDPPHLGHLIVAEFVRERAGLDEVRLVVANIPWQKTPDRVITDAERRVQLVDAAVAATPGLSVSRIEIDLGGPSYTMNTLEHLAEAEPGTSWALIVGVDAAAGLDSWHRADELRAAVGIIVVDRPGVIDGPPPGWRTEHVEVPQIGVSSSQIRHWVASGTTTRFVLPEPVRQLVDTWGLYRRSE